jgi:3'-5' exonuclease
MGWYHGHDVGEPSSRGLRKDLMNAPSLLFDRPVIAFDIETIPDPAMGRRSLGLEGTDAEVVRAMVEKRREETDGRSDYPGLPWHRVVSVCATILDPAAGHVEVRVLGGDLFDERSHVEGFFKLVAAAPRPPRLVSWNGSGFDLPVLRYRGMVIGVAAPDFYRHESGDGERRSSSQYTDRYGDLHVDLMDVLSGYGASSRVGLGMIAGSLGVPAKAFLDRAIFEHVVEGDATSIESYCKLDTVTTMLVFLAWAFHMGRVSRAELDRHVAALSEELGKLGDPRWAEIRRTLQSWPPWPA